MYTAPSESARSSTDSALNAVNTNDTAALENAIRGSTLQQLRDFTERMLAPEIVQKLRSSPLMKNALRTAVTERGRVLAETRAKLDEMRGATSEDIQKTITERLNRLDALIAQNPAPAAPRTGAMSLGNTVGSFASSIFTRLSGIPAIGWIFKPLAENPSGIFRTLQGALYTALANIPIPMLQNFGNAQLLRLNTLTTIEQSAPGRSFDARTLTPQVIQGARTTRPNLEADLPGLVTRAALAKPAPAVLTWNDIMNVEQTEKTGREQAETKIASATRAAFGAEKVSSVMLEADSRKAIAVREPNGKFAVTLGRNLINTTTGALSAPEAETLKDAVSRASVVAIRKIEIVEGGNPTTLKKGRDGTEIQLPVDTPQDLQRQLNTLAFTLKNNNTGVMYLRYDPLFVRAKPAIKLSAFEGQQAIYWNNTVQMRGPQALTTLPSDLNTADPSSNPTWEFEGGIWIRVPLPTRVRP